jgi:type IV pilus assembly protein PilA
MTPAPPAAPAQKKSGAPVVIIILAVLFGGCMIFGILAAIAIPNFIKFQSRSKQLECKTNLKMIFVAEKSNFADAKKYSASFKEIGFDPMAKTQRYSYFLTETEVSPANAPEALGASSAYGQLQAHGIKVGVTDSSFTAACVGSVDGDATQDIWSVSSDDRTGANGEPIPAGTPYNDQNDVAE